MLLVRLARRPPLVPIDDLVGPARRSRASVVGGPASRRGDPSAQRRDFVIRPLVGSHTASSTSPFTRRRTGFASGAASVGFGRGINPCSGRLRPRAPVFVPAGLGSWNFCDRGVDGLARLEPPAPPSFAPPQFPPSQFPPPMATGHHRAGSAALAPATSPPAPLPPRGAVEPGPHTVNSKLGAPSSSVSAPNARLLPRFSSTRRPSRSAPTGWSLATTPTHSSRRRPPRLRRSSCSRGRFVPISASRPRLPSTSRRARARDLPSPSSTPKTESARLEEARRTVAEHPLVKAAQEILGAELRDVRVTE